MYSQTKRKKAILIKEKTDKLHFVKTENFFTHVLASQVALVLKNLPANARDLREAGSIPGSGRSPGGGRGDPL